VNSGETITDALCVNSGEAIIQKRCVHCLR
jgi:hypothetical protein